MKKSSKDLHYKLMDNKGVRSIRMESTISEGTNKNYLVGVIITDDIEIQVAVHNVDYTEVNQTEVYEKAWEKIEHTLGIKSNKFTDTMSLHIIKELP